MYNQNRHKRIQYITQAAVIGAAYAVLTLLLAPFSFGMLQVRLSEGLCALSLVTPAAVPGLTLGCFLANCLGPNGILDAVLGSLATLIGALGARLLRRRRAVVALLPNILANGVIIGLMLCRIYGVDVAPLAAIAWVAAGEAVSTLVPGLLILKYTEKTDILQK